MLAHSDSRTDYGFIALANTIGHTILLRTLELAAHYLTHSANNQYKTQFYYDTKRCYAFVQGTGLDVILNQYGMSYDSDKLRKGFFYCLKRLQ